MHDSMMPWDEIHQYCESHTEQVSDLLKEVERYTHNHTLNPRMLSGRLQGRFLAMISKMLQPDVIVEIGTFTGYACLSLAEGLSSGGELHTYEVNDELEEHLKSTFQKSAYSSKIMLHIGDAIEELPKLNKKVDLAFIDAGKRDYPDYYEFLLDKMQSGSVILIDNVLWSGKVLKDDTDKTTEAIKQLNDNIAEDERVEKMLLPLRDGVYMVRKK